MTKILLIEDNIQNAQIFMRLCAKCGFHDIVHALNGLDGLRIVNATSFDLVFIDFDLPDIHGLNVGLLIANKIQSQNLPLMTLIALTAQSDRNSQLQAQRCGFDAFIEKPSTGADIASLLQQFT